MIRILASIAFFLVLSSACAYLDSDLTHLGYRGTFFDLVTSVSQKSVNVIVSKFLGDIYPTLESRSFVYKQNREDPGGPAFLPIPLEEAKKILGFDPFKIPDGATEDDNEKVATLLEKDMMFGIIFEFGTPNVADPDVIPDHMVFNRGKSQVNFNLVGKQFQTFELDQPDRGDPWTLFAVSQEEYLAENDENAPWAFKYDLPLEIAIDRACNYMHEFPDKTKELVKEIGKKFFARERPMIKIDEGKLNEIPSIPGIIAHTALANQLRPFFEETIGLIDPANDGVELATILVADRYPRSQTEEIPTDLNIAVSPHTVGSGTHSGLYDAYTLSYSMSTNQTELAIAQEYPWNWMEPATVKEFDGVMAVRRDVMSEFLKELLSPELEKGCFKPGVKINEGTSGTEIEWSLGAWETEPVFELAGNPSQHDAVMSFKCAASASDAGETVSAFLGTDSSFDVQYYENVIRIVSNVYIHAGASNSTEISGDVVLVNNRTIVKYMMGVGKDGGVVVTEEEGVRGVKRKNIVPDMHEISAAVSEKNSFSLEDTVNCVVGDLTKLMTGFSNHIRDRLDSVRHFVFPNRQTFKFQDMRFSKYLDVVSLITYVSDPAAKLAELEARGGKRRTGPRFVRIGKRQRRPAGGESECKSGTTVGRGKMAYKQPRKRYPAMGGRDYNGSSREETHSPEPTACGRARGGRGRREAGSGRGNARCSRC